MFDFQRSIISAVVTGWTSSWGMLLQYLWRSLAWMPCLRCLRMITTKHHQYMEGVCSRRRKAQDKSGAGSEEGTDKKSLLNYLIPQTQKKLKVVFCIRESQRHLHGCIRMSLGVCILMKPFQTSWRQNMWQV